MQISHRVNIFCNDLKHSHELALALQRAKVLNYFITGAGRNENKKSHNSFLELQSSSIIEYGWADLFRRVVNRLPISGEMQQQTSAFSENTMDEYVSRHFVKDVDALVGFSGSALKSFSLAKERGIKCVLDHPIIFSKNEQQILNEEISLNPDFAGTISGVLKNHVRLEKREEEIHLADLVLCGSYLAKQSFGHGKIKDEKIKLVPYGVDAEKFRCDRGEAFFKNNIIRILFAGNIGQQRGIKYLLEAIKQIGNKKIELTLVGDFSGPTAAYKPYREWFRHVPRVPHNLMRGYYAKADLLVLPAVSEGFGLEVLEAMASGMPVVVSENTGAKDMIEDGKEGFVIPVRDIDRLKEKILYFYESPIKVLEMGEFARKKALSHSWLYYQGNIKSIFDQLLEKQR